MVEKECNPHPMAPHGFLRQASHSAGRYVCECEYWDETDYNLSIANILEGEKITVDDTVEYSESTHEKQAEFDKKRNYVYMSPSINAQWKIEIKDPWDEWKASRDIV
jgi:hypothetical protein